MKIGWVLNVSEAVRGYGEVREMALRVEAEGLDSLWIPDHLLYRSSPGETRGIWEAWTFLSSLAEATNRVELGPLVACTQFRNPAILAKMAITLDEVSEGRLTLGVGAGWNEPEFRAFGMPFDHLVGRFEEAVRIIKPLLRDGFVDFQGTYYQVRECEIKPRGKRLGGPPLLIAGWRPRMLRLAARYADIWNTGYALPSFSEPYERLLAACAEEGRDPSTLEMTHEILLDFPDLRETPTASNVVSILRGSTEEIAQALLQYEQLGIGHIMVQCTPSNPVSLSRFLAAVKMYRSLPHS
jgi:alkanesulfonate monooxygenase SsuD/methylene tetrahydromethanopterin reductase-like flavin-dependent oxidoreductase (luciferase family)